MAYLVLPSHRRVRQPTRIRQEFASFAKSVIVGGVPYDLVRNVALPSGLTAGANANGATWITPTPEYQLAAESNDVVPSGSEVTILWQNKHTDYASNSGSGSIGNVLLGEHNATYVFNIYLHLWNTTKTYFRWGGETTNITSLMVSGLSRGPDDWWAFTAGPRGMEIWQNGVKVGSTASTPSRTATAGRKLFLGTAFDISDSDTATEAFTLLAFLSRQLPTNFLAQKNYWSLFADPRPLYFDLSRPKGTMRPTVMV